MNPPVKQKLLEFQYLDQKLKLQIEKSYLNTSDKQELQERDRHFKFRQTPMRVSYYDQVLQKKKLIETLNKDQIHKKLTMVEFVRKNLTRHELKKIENPYGFASGVNVNNFIKEYYASLIQNGLIRPKKEKHPPIQSQNLNLTRPMSSLPMSARGCSAKTSLWQNNQEDVQLEILSYEHIKDDIVSELSNSGRVQSGLALSNRIHSPSSVLEEQRKQRKKSLSQRSQSGIADNNLKINKKYEQLRKLGKGRKWSDEIMQIVNKRKLGIMKHYLS